MLLLTLLLAAAQSLKVGPRTYWTGANLRCFLRRPDGWLVRVFFGLVIFGLECTAAQYLVWEVQGRLQDQGASGGGTPCKDAPSMLEAAQLFLV